MLQGTFTPLAPQLALQISNTATSEVGRFINSRSTLGTYTWPAGPDCIDKVTNGPLMYDWTIIAPPFRKIMITDLALLTVPASRHFSSSDSGNSSAGGGAAAAAGVVSAESDWVAVWGKVHESFGINPLKLKVRRPTPFNLTIE